MKEICVFLTIWTDWMIWIYQLLIIFVPTNFNSMKLPEEIIHKIEHYLGRDLGNPSDKDIVCLSDHIFEITHERLGFNTLKRLLGTIKDAEGSHSRNSTLNIIARYLGSANWNVLLSQADQGTSSFTTLEGELSLSDLKKEDMIEVTYQPNRKIVFSYLGDGQFEVKESLNSKLKGLDVCTINSLIINYPLIAEKVVREGVCLGRYIAAKEEGLLSIKVIG